MPSCRPRRGWKRRAIVRRPASGTRSSSWASRFARTRRCSHRSAGSGRGAGALVDLNLEGGENRVDIDLFGDPEGERSQTGSSVAKESDDTASDRRIAAPACAAPDLDFTLDAPERGADESPTREMPPRDEPTVESELMNFADAPTAESPALKTNEMRDRISSKLRRRRPTRRPKCRSTIWAWISITLEADSASRLVDSISHARGDRSSGRCADHGGGPG